jgi:uncharacterized protein YjbI with pentapeptide repeats
MNLFTFARQNRKISLVCILLCITGIVYAAHKNGYIFVPRTTAELNWKPELLNGLTLRNSELNDLNFENVTLKDVTFKEVNFRRPRFKNVVFENCNFEGSRFSSGVYEDVLFKGGSMQPTTSHGRIERQEFIYSQFSNVVLDGVKIHGGKLSGTGDLVIVKNMPDINGFGSHRPSFFSGTGNRVRIDNCIVKNTGFVHDEGKVYITNSTFHNATMAGHPDVAYIDKCSANEGLTGAKICVATNSDLMGGYLGGGKAYFINNKYRDNVEKNLGFKTRGDKNTFIYIIGNGSTIIPYYALGGNVTIIDSELKKPYFIQNGDILSLNLRNVTIRGGEWIESKVLGGQWENVKIYPSVDITGAVIKNVRGYNVTFPEGPPWTGNSRGQAEMIVSKTPFTWPEIHVPTPEELGLIWEEPVITGRPPAGK